MGGLGDRIDDACQNAAIQVGHQQDQPSLSWLALTLASSSQRAKSPCWTPVVERTTTLPKRGWHAQCGTTRTKAALLEGSAAVNAFAGVLKVNSEYHFRRIAHVGMDPLPDRTGAHQKEGQETLSWQALPQHSATSHHHLAPSAMGRRPTSFLGSAVRDTPAGNGPNEGGAPPSARSSTKELTGFFAGASLHKTVDRCPRQQR